VYAGATTPPPPPTGTQNVEYRTLTGGEISAKQLTLANTPSTASLVMVDLIGASAQIFNFDFTVASNILSWTGLALDGQVVAGDVLRVFYFS
jgi:hypothetical protein